MVEKLSIKFIIIPRLPQVLKVTAKHVLQLRPFAFMPILSLRLEFCQIIRGVSPKL